jgi:dynein heavy chain
VKLVIEDAENKKQLKEIEDTILKLLKEAEGNILDDEVLIDTLSESKVTSTMIEAKVEEAEKTAVVIANTRKSYVPVAFRASQLFFCIADLAGVDPMYQYSLEWFINLFILAIEKAEKTNIIEERLKNLNDSFSYILYVNVCRSLFEKDKLLFSFLLTSKILLGENKMSPSLFRFFLQGNTAMDLEKPNPLQDGWLSDKSWGEIIALSKNKGFENFDQEFTSRMSDFEKAYTSVDPMKVIDEVLDDPEHERYSLFMRLNVLRCLRPDSVVPAVMHFVKDQIGQRFIEPPPFNLMAGYQDSNCATPLIFVLTPGAAPMSELLVLAEELGFTKKLSAISLGQGQGPLAEKAIDEAVDKGTWVCLQNCHLCVSWMPTLEKTCEEISPERAHSDFRLWLTSEPSKAFPQFVLQNGVKMTNEPPKGMRANMMGTYHGFTDDWFESCNQPAAFKKMVFGLCFFHATVRERKKFGPLGWNIQYVFSTPDLLISRDQLKIFLDDLGDGDPVPYEALRYLVGECNYGGRVTDDKDRRCINNILTDFYCPEIQDDSYKFSPSGTYYVPPETDVEGYMEYIKTLPFNDAPEVFGLHENANITSAIAETNTLLSVALSLQEKTSGGEGMSWEDTLTALASDIDGRVPDLYDNEKADIDFPVTYGESMNTVLTQELIRFNRLIDRIHRTLKEVQKAVKGLVVMSGELEGMGNSMVNGIVPAMWNAVSYPSLKPLGSWVLDFLARLSFLQEWFDSCKSPEQYWISGFFFTQAFITGTKQNFARKYQVPIDQVSYDMTVLSFEESEKITQKPEDGAYVNGLFIEGCYFNNDLHALDESDPKILYTPMPHIWLQPKKVDDIEPVEDDVPGGTCHVYQCPVYKTSFRQGTLSTTGHSTNFVMLIRVPMQPQHKQKHWIKRGVAMLTQLDD